VRLILKAAVANAVGIVLLYFVQLDLLWRNSCGPTTTPQCIAHVASVSYLPFIRVSRLSASGLPLVSPPTLDLFQVLVVFLVIIDAYYIARYLLGRSKRLSATHS
jgi:hypothetical protein